MQSPGHGPAEGCGSSQLVLQPPSGPKASVTFPSPTRSQGIREPKAQWVGPWRQGKVLR